MLGAYAAPARASGRVSTIKPSDFTIDISSPVASPWTSSIEFSRARSRPDTEPRRRSRARSGHRGANSFAVHAHQDNSSANGFHDITGCFRIPFSVNLGRSQFAVAEDDLSSIQAKPLADSGCDGVTKLVWVPPMGSAPRTEQIGL
jgi:hypothetical protein